MRLSTKITAASIGLLFLFTQIFSLGQLYIWQKEMLSYTEECEWKLFDAQCRQFQQKLTQTTEKYEEEEKIYRAKNLFGTFFPMDAALYYNNQEISNLTVYKFEPELMKAEISDRDAALSEGKAVNKNPCVFYREVKDRKLLILFREIEELDVIYCQDITDIYNEVRIRFKQGFIAAVGISFLLLILLRFVLNRILNPLFRLKNAANQIAGGEYSQRIPIDGAGKKSITKSTGKNNQDKNIYRKDEIREISESFNQMAEKVETHVAELEEMNEKQNLLLGSLSHELRTPLTAISGYAQTLRNVKLSPEKQNMAFSYMIKECGRLSGLSEKMLELTGLSDSSGSINLQRVSVEELFQCVQKTVSVRLQEKRLYLQVETSREWVTGDEDLLISFLVNLIDNARKASKEESTIRLTGNKEGLWVCDQGYGIPEKELKHISDPFYMVDKSRSRREGGAGLGLAICKKIAELHNGEFVIQSCEGKGTIAGIKLSEKDEMGSGENTDEIQKL